MFRTAKAVVLSVLLGASAVSLAPASAQADSLYFSLGFGGPRGDVVLDDGYRPASDVRRPSWDRPPPGWDRPRPSWDRPPPYWGRPLPPPTWNRPPDNWAGPGCTPGYAVRKAYRMGLDRPFVARENGRMIVVAGVGARGREWISFGRYPGCPILR
ncbi:MAG: hypothetical protein M9924_12455 [Rhizobiaceae bacterium]|nr:hypothetical protein [Rhizobiaceae bacterium]